MEQAVTCGEVDAERWRLREAMDTAATQRLDHQAEACDGCRVGVEVNAIHLVQRQLREFRDIRGGLAVLPAFKEPAERADEEVTGSTRWVNQPHLFVAELGDGRLKC